VNERGGERGRKKTKERRKKAEMSSTPIFCSSE